MNVRLEGKITNTAITMSRDILVAIEFLPLSETEQAITAVLSVMSDVLVNASTPAVLIEASTASHRLVRDVGEKGRGTHGVPHTSATSTDGMGRVVSY